MPKLLEIFISKEGDMLTLSGDELLCEPIDGQAEVTIARASHVEPEVTPQGIRWSADMGPIGGPVLEGYKTRELALAAEVDYIRTELTHSTLCLSANR